MSKYTTEVRFICETAAGLSESVGFSDVESVLEKSWDKIFSPSIPFYKEEKRSELCQKILAHYYTREIGFETVGLWKLNLNRKMREIMPYYNELYKTLDLVYSPLQDVDYFEHHENKDTFQETTSGTTSRESTTTGTTKDTRTGDLSETTSHSSETSGSTTDSTTVSSTGKNTDSTTVSNTVSTTGKTTDSANGSTTSKTIRSDTPQNDLTDFEAEQYLTSAEKTTGTSTQTGNGTSEGESVTSGTTSVTGSTEGNETTEGTGTSSGTTTESGTRANTGTVKDEGTRTETGSETGSSAGTRDNNGTGTGDIHVWGKRGGQSYAAAIKEYREQILNVDIMVINELGDLFMKLW